MSYDWPCTPVALSTLASYDDCFLDSLYLRYPLATNGTPYFDNQGVLLMGKIP